MFYGLTFVYAFTTQIQSNLFPAFAMSLGEDPTVVGGIVLFVGVARTVVFCLSGIIERSSKRPLVFVGPTLIAIAMGLIFIGQKPWHFALACFILGLGSGISYFLSLSTVLGKANFALGLRAGLFESMIGTGSALGPFLGGLVSAVNPRYPYALSGLVCILVMLYLFGKTIKSEKKN
jgi:MFS family permease